MNIIICGAGQVGTHVADVLAGSGYDITIIDQNPEKINLVADAMDVATLCGNCTSAEVLREADSAHADLVIAATNRDEINLLCCAVARGIGAKMTIARTHHQTFFEQRGLDYREHLGIDRLICPEHATALAIASTLRNPGSLAIEKFARGQIEMHEFTADENVPGINKPLSEVPLPHGTRLAAVSRNGDVFITTATTEVHTGDRVVLVGNTDTFDQARKLFRKADKGKRRVAIMGGPSMAVWLCRALRDRDFSIRLFETNRARAEELADKLSWVTVIQADPMDPDVATEEHIGQGDVFIALTNDDENNIIGSATAKQMGVHESIAVVQRPIYLRLLKSIGVDQSFSPRHVAAKEIAQLISTATINRIASLAEGVIEVYWVRAGDGARVVGKPLRELQLSPNWMVAAIEHGNEMRVPGADEIILGGDAVLVIGRHGKEKQLRKLFGAG